MNKVFRRRRPVAPTASRPAGPVHHPDVRLVVIPGLPRSGTTYLFHQLLTRNPGLFNSARRKEHHFFDEAGDVERFKSFYGECDPDKLYMDASPAYLTRQTPAIPNILDFGARETRFILCLRHPVDQLYAHYIHDIKAHWARRQFGDDVARSLFTQQVLRQYLAMRAEAIERIVEGVGAENVCAVNFHQDLPRPDRLTTKLSAFLGERLEPLPDEVVGPGGQLPYYLYGGDAGTEIADGEALLRVPPRALLLVNNKESDLWEDVDPHTAERLALGAMTWARELGGEQFQVLERAFQDDWSRLLDLLGLDAADFAVDHELRARPARLSPEIAARLAVSRPLTEVVAASTYRSGLGTA